MHVPFAFILFVAGLLCCLGGYAVRAALARRRRRTGFGVYTPVATKLVWLDSPPSLASIGATANSRAIVVDQHNVQMAVQPAITYTSGTTSVATINSSGVVTSVANGSSLLTAASTGLTSITQTATVAQQPASISGVSTTLSTDDASSGTFTPSALDANGNTISGATFGYTSNQPSVISVNPTSGAWAGQSAGSATITITATANGASVSFVVNVTVTHLTYTLTAVPDPITGNPTNTFQLTVTENGVDVTSDSGTSYSTSDKTIATVDAPTLTSIAPNTITQGTNASYTFTGTNIKGTETIGGLPSGVTASAYSYTSTTVVCTLTATGAATTGAASVNLVSTRGDSGVQTLTVNASGGTPAGTPQTVQYLRASAAATAPATTKSATLPLTNNTSAVSWYAMNTTVGAAGTNTGVTAASTTPQSAIRFGWVSATALSAQTIASGTWTLKIGANVSTVSAPAWTLSPVLYVYRPGTSSVVGTIRDSATGISSNLTGSYTTGGKVMTFTGSTVTCQSGDLLVLEMWAVGGNGTVVDFLFDTASTVTEGGDCSAYAKAELDFPASIYFGG